MAPFLTGALGIEDIQESFIQRQRFRQKGSLKLDFSFISFLDFSHEMGNVIFSNCI